MFNRADLTVGGGKKLSGRISVLGQKLPEMLSFFVKIKRSTDIAL